MNWTEIKEKYPKANKAALQYGIIHSFNEAGNRWLYDFFDEHGIIGMILYEEGFFYQGLLDSEGKMLNEPENKGYSLRIDAEERMWIKAFEILENKLK